MNDVLNALFTHQRLQILSLAVHHDEYSDAYLYAWYSGVYPFFEDTDGSVMRKPHEHYKEQFRISAEKVDELSLFLDQCELNDEVPTFYELEEHFRTRYRESEWSRSDLLKICRYFFLRGMWHEDFWKKVIAPMKHPSEAASIVRKFDRKSDIYFE
ncbi:hypothetical protein [Aeromonas caviae]|uniref:hypothetical protein n=1 Tax=Aeromonas caviae TaxID=648 RepID=UPI0029D6B4BD|nr:hypothetical protein [Aeromonas caviae]MDX7786026.1 hypothetical protein [Aeromonas caviae]